MYLQSEHITNFQKQETSTKYKAHEHQTAVEGHRYFEDFHRKFTKQPEIAICVTS